MKNKTDDFKLICINPSEQPIVGYVEFVFDQHKETLMRPISSDGTLTIPDLGSSLPDIAVVKPTDGHWPIVVSPSEQRLCVCPVISFPHDLLWWRDLPFGSKTRPDFGAGVKVGVIDIPAKRCHSLSHVQMYDIEGQPVEENELHLNSHGLRVSAMISERGESDERRGIAPFANVTLIDVTDDDFDGEWDYAKIAPAIQILVDEFDVDLINISGGCTISTEDPRFEDAQAFFADAVEYASKNGALVVASTGNAPNAPVALPARLDDVIGVGAVGKANLAPDETRTKAYENWAVATPGCSGSLERADFFHFRDTTSGFGLDMVGPGIGVVMTFEDGSCVEYDGTSYAAPYVTAVAACAFSMNAMGSEGLKDRRRRDMLRSHIELLCADLGMDKARQGSGIPVLVNEVAGRPC